MAAGTVETGRVAENVVENRVGYLNALAAYWKLPMIMQRLPSDDFDGSDDSGLGDPAADLQVGWMYRGVPQNREAFAHFHRVDSGHASSPAAPQSQIAAPVWISVRRIVRQSEFSQLYFG